jgi:ubiquitin carboxyl-terminal hydrolase L3
MACAPCCFLNVFYVGLLHAIGNNYDKLSIRKGSFFSNFFSKTDDLTQSERAKVLEKSKELEDVHDEVANEGDTEAPDRDAHIRLHFICFVEKEGSMFELDGRKTGPIYHGKTSSERLLEDSCAVIKKNFMEVDPEAIEFTMVALGPGENPFVRVLGLKSEGKEERD